MDSVNGVIFLDIDGVLTSSRVYVATNEKIVGGTWGQFDPVAVQFLNHVCANYGYKVVISSTWRNHYDRSTIGAILKGNGCRFKLHPNWKTDRFKGSRGEQIERWFENDKSVNHYIILDDDSDFSDEQRKYHVKTCGLNGMMLEHYSKLDKLCVSQRDKVRNA